MRIIKMSKRFIILAICLSGVFVLTNYNFFSKEKEPEKVVLKRKVMVRTIKKLKKEKNLYCDGFGGFGVKVVEMSALSFVHEGEPYDIDKARKLLVYAAEVFLNEFNSFEKIRPYLANYPFTSKNIELRIFFVDDKNHDYFSPNLTTASSIRGKFFYKMDENNYYKTVHEETYEEALAIVNKNNSEK